MRRVALLLAVVGTMLLATAALAVSEWDSYKDSFSSVSYSGSDGTIEWKKPWVEIGESDGPTTGTLHVDPDYRCADNKCLHIWAEGTQFNRVGVVRYADLSIFGEAELCYYITRSANEQFLEIADSDLLIQVTTDGSSWKTIDSFGLETIDEVPIHRSKGLDNYLTEGFGVRFIVEGTLGGEVFIDDIEIKGAHKTSSTTPTTTPTTTTTRPKVTTTTRPETSIRDTTTMSAPTTTSSIPTTTTTELSTSTTEIAAVPATRPPTNGGIRQTGAGVMTSFESDMFDAMGLESEVLGVELDAEYQMAVEVFESSWVWTLGLAMIVTAILLAGLDKRRTRLGPATG